MQNSPGTVLSCVTVPTESQVVLFEAEAVARHVVDNIVVVESAKVVTDSEKEVVTELEVTVVKRVAVGVGMHAIGISATSSN